MEMTRRKWIGISALGVGGAVAASLLRPQTSLEQSSSREALRQRHFPDVRLTTHEFREVRFYEDLVKDKIVTINFIYTRCEDGRCPLATANLARVQRLLGDRIGRDVFMYSITLAPEQDSPGVLARYAFSYDIGPGWKFLTGAPADIELLRRKLGFTWADPVRDAQRTNHIGTLRYGNEPLQWWAACPALSNPSWIAESLSWVDWPNREHAALPAAPEIGM